MNVKPDDLAVLVSPSFNSGATVEVIRSSDDYVQGTYGPIYGHMWEVKMLGPGVARREGHKVFRAVEAGAILHTPDRFLKRLDDPDGNVVRDTYSACETCALSAGRVSDGNP